MVAIIVCFDLKIPAAGGHRPALRSTGFWITALNCYKQSVGAE